MKTTVHMQVRVLWQQSCLVQALDLLLPRLEASKAQPQQHQLLLHAFAGLISAAPAALVRLHAWPDDQTEHLESRNLQLLVMLICGSQC